MGGNEEATFVSGINVARYKIVAYCFSGVGGTSCNWRHKPEGRRRHNGGHVFRRAAHGKSLATGCGNAKHIEQEKPQVA
ncbi:MAG: hypothetical protein ACPLPR_03085 [Bacillota bacterium]